jgi:hypothetical protein
MPPVPHSISNVYSLLQRLRSLRHRLWYDISERVRWSRGAYHETPARELPALTLEQSQRIAALRSRYQVHFELGMNAATAINNYEYLDILDRAWAGLELGRPFGGLLCDIGCASFWYAGMLQAFFSPARIVGVEVEGYRLLRNGHTRYDYARGYLSDLADGSFVIADYAGYHLPAEVITAWFPFVTPAAILAWRLPLSLLTPRRMFERIFHNLKPGGLFVMVNHGPIEAELAHELCDAAGLRFRGRSSEPGILSGHRPVPAVLSCWAGAPG